MGTLHPVLQYSCERGRLLVILNRERLMKTRLLKKGRRALQSEEMRRQYIKFTKLWNGLIWGQGRDPFDPTALETVSRRFAEFTERFVGHIGLGYDPADVDRFRRARLFQNGFARQHQDVCLYFENLAGSWMLSEEAQTCWPRFDRRDVPTALQSADLMLDETMLALFLIADKIVKFLPHDEPDGRTLPHYLQDADAATVAAWRKDAAAALNAVEENVLELDFRKHLRKLKAEFGKDATNVALKMMTKDMARQGIPATKENFLKFAMAEVPDSNISRKRLTEF